MLLDYTKSLLLIRHIQLILDPVTKPSPDRLEQSPNEKTWEQMQSIGAHIILSGPRGV